MLLKKKALGLEWRPGAWRIPAMTDFRAIGTIMGPTGLTAVFGMGTGVAPPVWSPENRRAGRQARPARSEAIAVSRPVTPARG